MKREEIAGRRSYEKLRLGEIRPAGWLERQLSLQAKNITGQLEYLWDDVSPNSAWLGGAGEDWERGPYYLDGLVALAYTLNDQTLIQRAQVWIDAILASQAPDGQFGPTSNVDWWPRMVVLKAMTQIYDAVEDPRVIRFLTAYFRFQARELPKRPLTSWGKFRGAENIFAVLWLHAHTGDDSLLDLIDEIARQSADWHHFFENDLITGRATRFSHFTHGPNVAMGLKFAAAAHLRDGSGHWRSAAQRYLENLDRWHGQAHGWFSGDEWLAGREATQGIETCQVSETLFSLETNLQVFGDSRYGDMIESVAFNLLPASSDPEMRAHQYVQQANQVLASVAPRAWSYSGDDTNTFGFLPNFGCCTANLHQAWPKFVSCLWLRSEKGLVAISYAPAVVVTRVDGHDVRLAVEGDYPFDDQVKIVVESADPTVFELCLRVPEWCDSFSILVNGLAHRGASRDGYVVVERTWEVGDTIELSMPMHPRVVRRERQAVAVRVGPLAMVYSPGEIWDPTPDADGLGGWSVRPRRSWNYGIVVEGELGLSSWKVSRRPSGEIPFALESAPLMLEARGARIPGWNLSGSEADHPPDSPVLAFAALETVLMVPYASARLRVCEMPQLAWNARLDPH